MGLKRGDLIRWVVDYDAFEAGATLRPIRPVYAYGIIIKVSNKEPDCVAVFQISGLSGLLYKRRKTDNAIKHLHMAHDVLEVISGG